MVPPKYCLAHFMSKILEKSTKYQRKLTPLVIIITTLYYAFIILANANKNELTDMKSYYFLHLLQPN